MNPELQEFCSRLAAAVFNGTYQGVLLVVLIGLGARLVPGLNAATRHAIGLFTLLLMAALPVAHFFVPSARPEGPMVNTTPEPPETMAAIPSRNLSLASLLEQPPMPGDPSSESVIITRDWPVWEEPSTVARPFSRGAEADGSRVSSSFAWPGDWQFALPPKAALVLVLLWVLIGGTRLAWLGRQCQLLRALKRRGISASPAWQGRFAALRAQMGVAREARLLVSSETATPIAAGFCDPAILLCGKLLDGAEASHVDHILRHELAHLARRDDWANLFQQTIHAIFFFHPGVRWLSRRLTVEREIACDDHVLAAVGTRRAYALFLTEFASRTQGREWAVAPAAWSSKSQLKERIHMILDSKRNSSPRTLRVRAGVFTTAAALLALFGLQAAPRLALGDDTPSAEPKKATVEKSVSAAVTAEVNTDLELEANANSNAPKKPKARTIAPESTDDGPRPKPAPASKAVGRTSAVPAAPSATPVAPRAVTSVYAQNAPVSAQPAGLPPGPKGPDRNSLERRMERLERMVESLMAREKRGGGENSNFNLKNPQWPNVDKNHFGGSTEEMARMKEQMSREMERASRDIERAAKEAARAATEANRFVHPDVFGYGGTDTRQQLETQRKTLESQRVALEKQLKTVEKRLEQLEKEHEKREKDHEKTPEKSKPSKDSEHGKGSPDREREDDDRKPKR